jgi:hypothetical protein
MDRQAQVEDWLAREARARERQLRDAEERARLWSECVRQGGHTFEHMDADEDARYCHICRNFVPQYKKPPFYAS